MAAIGVSLWKYVMRYAPHTPTYFNRDRFVLSNGGLCYKIATFVLADRRQDTPAYSSTHSSTLQATRQ